MKTLKKNLFATLGIMLILTMMSCKSKQSNNYSSEDYLRCNATSQGNMAEIESGFYYLNGSLLMYADRSDMTNWVLVCNKPDCPHTSDTMNCNANINSEITQKNDKIYFYKKDIYTYPTQEYIYQVKKDGSEPIKVFKLPLDYSSAGGGRSLISQEGFFRYHRTLSEDGFYEKTIYRLEEDGSLYTLFSQKYEENKSDSHLPSYVNEIRGDFTIMSSLLIEDGDNVDNVLFRVDGDKPERVNLPKDVSVLCSYLTEDTFTYYRPNEGFFEIDLKSQKETCIMENQLEDARGCILTEDYLIECNRYKDNRPEEAYLRFFDGSKWIDVELPEIVAKTDCYFSVISVGTDRVFCRLLNNLSQQLYYFMLGEENPTLTLAMTIGDVSDFEMIELEEESDIVHEVDITIFDTEEYTAKLTAVGFGLTKNGKGKPNMFGMKVSFENKTDKTLRLHTNDMAINGVAFMFGNAATAKPYETVEKTYSITLADKGLIDWNKKLTSFLFSAFVLDENNKQMGMTTIAEVYPYGEENVKIQERESLSTDDVLIDNEFVKLTAIEYWESGNKKGTVKMVVENKTDSMISCGVNEIISINGQSLNQLIGEGVTLLPNSYGYLTVGIDEQWFESISGLKEMIGDEIKEYSVNFSVYEQGLLLEEAGQCLFETPVLLNPKQ